MTDAELRDAAVALLKQTTVGYVNKYWKTPPAGTKWKDALDLLAEIGVIVPPPPPPPPGKVTMQDLKGVCIGVGDPRGPQMLGLIPTLLGARTARCDYSDLKRTGFMDAAVQAGVEVLMVACYSNGLAAQDHMPPDLDKVPAWVKLMVDMKVRWNLPAVECYNEPWLTNFWQPTPDPARYLNLSKALAEGLWAVDPDCIVVVSADYWQQGSGVSGRKFMDGVIAADKTGFLTDPRVRPSTHNYCNNAKPQDTRTLGWAFNRWELAYDAFKAHGHPDPQVRVTEYGYDTQGGGETSPVTEAQQAQYIPEGIRMMFDSRKVSHAYGFQWRWENWYGWLRPDGSARPVVKAVHDLA